MNLLDLSCRAALRLFPPAVRARHGDEMRETFAAACRAAWPLGPAARARTVLAELWNLAKSAVDVHRDRPRIPAGRSPRSSRQRGSTMWFDDVKHALRRLRSNPATAAASVLMLGLAIGLSTAMFTLVDAVLIRPVPFPDSDRLARLWMRGEHGGRVAVSLPVMDAWRTSGMFDAVEAFSPESFILGSGDGMTERPAAFVSPGLPALLGARPIVGRLFLPDEGRAGTDDRVLISEGLWRTLFGADVQIVGRRTMVDGADVTVVGVMPASFRFPVWNTTLWRPLDFTAPPPREAKRLPRPVVRIAPGVPRDDAMKAATAAAYRADTLPPKQWAAAESLASPYGGQYARQAAPVLGACAAIVFLVLCANVSGLLLARLEVRRRDIGVAVALGASRVRLIREALFESALLASAGLALGLALAFGLVGFAGAYLPASLLANTLNPLDLDVRALALGSAAAIAAALAAGLLPAVLAPRVAPMIALRAATRSGTEGTGGRTLRRALLIGEVALAFTLLVGAALLVRSFMSLAGADRGVNTDNVIVGLVSGVGGETAARPERAAMGRAIEAALRDLPGARQVALSRGAPPDGFGFTTGDWVSDVPGLPAVSTTIESYAVGQEFFDIYGIPVLRGRSFQPGDPADAVIVGQRLAGMLWPGIEPVGRSFGIDKRRFQVIGVARELHLPTTEGRLDRPEFYTPLLPGAATITLNIRCDGVCPDPARVRQRVRDVQADAMVWNLGPLDAEYEQHVESPRAAALLVLAFAAVAALAVAGGLFAVLSYLARRRRREFGIRLALGARPRQLRALVLREGATMLAAGAAVGAISAWWATKGLASLMYGVTLRDPGSWMAVLAVLAGIALLASWWPAARAARIDPSILLREE